MRRNEALLKIRARLGPAGTVRGSAGACQIGKLSLLESPVPTEFGLAGHLSYGGQFTLLGQGHDWATAWEDAKNTMKELL